MVDDLRYQKPQVPPGKSRVFQRGQDVGVQHAIGRGDPDAFTRYGAGGEDEEERTCIHTVCRAGWNEESGCIRLLCLRGGPVQPLQQLLIRGRVPVLREDRVEASLPSISGVGASPRRAGSSMMRSNGAGSTWGSVTGRCTAPKSRKASITRSLPRR